MPELPEVETIRRGLQERLLGATISGVEVRAVKVAGGDLQKLVGKNITEVRRHGKLLVFMLDNGDAFEVHLKMTGQLLWRGEGKEAVMGGHPSQGYLDPLPHKHTHVIISFADGATLYFNDLRKFGRVAHLTPADLENHRFVKSLGPEPFDKRFTVTYLTEKLQKKSKTPIKTFLLDQTNIAGLGNIYADESCFRSHILPMRLTGSLKPGEIKTLHDAIKETIDLAIKYGGSSERDYVNAIGEKGTYLKVACVYHRTGLPCTRADGGVIQVVKVNGRSTHFCPVCQK
jgi:formamidopyrimidine-DNA glycosylase